MTKVYVSRSMTTAMVLILLVLLVPAALSTRNIARPRSRHGRHHISRVVVANGVRDTVDKVAGSRLPDCSHACGSCTPCRLVMVSFVCSSLEEAETCPMAYKCMCNNKSYPVP